MEIWELDKLVLFITFVVPGFISIKVYQLFYPGANRDVSEQTIDAVTYSSINYAVLALPVMWVEAVSLSKEHRILYYIFYVFVLFVAPVLWVFLWKKIRESRWVQRDAPHPTSKPWDYVFSQRKPYWVKVVLKDGSIIAGRYGENSFSSSAPASEQIYLEETWVLNERGGFERKKNNTAGVIVLSTEISHIELRN